MSHSYRITQAPCLHSRGFAKRWRRGQNLQRGKPLGLERRKAVCLTTRRNNPLLGTLFCTPRRLFSPNCPCVPAMVIRCDHQSCRSSRADGSTAGKPKGPLPPLEVRAGRGCLEVTLGAGRARSEWRGTSLDQRDPPTGPGGAQSGVVAEPS